MVDTPVLVREYSQQIAAKLMPCPHANGVSLRYVCLSAIHSLQHSGRGDGGLVLVGGLAAAAARGFDGFHNIQ